MCTVPVPRIGPGVAPGPRAGPLGQKPPSPERAEPLPALPWQGTAVAASQPGWFWVCKWGLD